MTTRPSSTALRVVFLNPFETDAPFAERELALRMLAAAKAIGWEAVVAHRAAEIEAFDPDMVISLHPQVTPKLTRHFTVACHWNPPKLHEAYPVFMRNERSYDGFLTAGDDLRQRLADLFWPTARPLLTAPIYPSSPAWALEPTLNPDSQLFYIGSNWDGKRYPHLLKRLAAAGVLALHGRRDRWAHMADAFTGEVPFDGRSVIEKANACGLGLALHLPVHAQAAIPNMRIFELAAAGALTIADHHPFIVEAFGENVLYVDLKAGEMEVAEQILAHVAWARANPLRGREMARAAQAIFVERFSLEKLFAPLPDLLERGRRMLGFERPLDPAAQVPVDLVLPVEPGGWDDALARVEAVGMQTAGRIGVILAHSGDVTVPERLLRPVADLRMVRAPDGAAAGTVLWAGLRAAMADWVGIVPPGARLFPNHVATLLAAAAELDVDVVHGGAVQPMVPEECYELFQAEARPVPVGFDPVETTTVEATASTLHPASLLIRRARLTSVLRRDPELGEAAAGFLAHRVLAGGLTGSSGLLTVSVDRRADAPVFAARERVQRLSLLRPPAAVNGGSPRRESEMAITGFTDPDPELAARLPRLWGHADFASLPRDRPIYLYGASRGGRIVKQELDRWSGLAPTGFVDGLWAGDAWGLSVSYPESIADALRDATVIISSQHVSEIARRLAAIGIAEPYNAYPFIAWQVHIDNLAEQGRR
ncbi:glycosyltransferase [Asticcacaulis sp.]|uniref:glycosyltransferase family protein n=1 Tax=Asticcacaulis sp. TaxID=1872648 RepID=UPI00260C6DF5|nr:glycosyltransferase [Asticcacaulis sp.]